MGRVLDCLLTELATHACRQQRTVFLGGGTPTHLEPEQLERLLDGLDEHLDLHSAHEVTSEANPESIDRTKLSILRGHGVRRLSIGVQALDRGLLQFLDRPHGPEQALEAYRLARDLFDEVSLDLIYGIPGQSLASWLDTLERVLELEPTHLSCYCLTYEPGTRLHGELHKHSFRPLPETVASEMVVATHTRLGEAGLPAYEISNFARPGHECLHNLNYWRGGNYVGIGPDASGHRNGLRTTNDRSLQRYVRSIETSGSATASAETLDPSSRCREAIWLGLRLMSGADLDGIAATTGRDPREVCQFEIARQVAEGRCCLSGSQLRLTREALLYADGVAAEFLAPSST